MRGLRLVLILAVLLDLGSPSLPDRSDDFGEFRGAVHGRGRIVRLVPETAREPASVGRPVTLSPRVSAPRRPPVRPTRGPGRKSPPSLSDPASGLDDH